MGPRKEAVKGRKCWKFPDKIAANVAVTANLFLSPLAANKSDAMCNNYGQHGVLTFTLHSALSDDIKAAHTFAYTKCSLSKTQILKGAGALTVNWTAAERRRVIMIAQ